jgi:hypothetical protein
VIYDEDGNEILLMDTFTVGGGGGGGSDYDPPELPEWPDWDPWGDMEYDWSNFPDIPYNPPPVQSEPNLDSEEDPKTKHKSKSPADVLDLTKPAIKVSSNVTVSVGGHTFTGELWRLPTKEGGYILVFYNTSSDFRGDTNCHGYTLGNGCYIIDNEMATNFLNNTTLLERTTDPQVGDIAVWRDENGIAEHSARVTEIDDNGTPVVTMAAGAEVFPDGSRIDTCPVDEARADGSLPEYWHRK